MRGFYCACVQAIIFLTFQNYKHKYIQNFFNVIITMLSLKEATAKYTLHLNLNMSALEA